MSAGYQHLENLLDSAAEIATMAGLWCVVAARTLFSWIDLSRDSSGS